MCSKSHPENILLKPFMMCMAPNATPRCFALISYCWPKASSKRSAYNSLQPYLFKAWHSGATATESPKNTVAGGAIDVV